MPRHAGLGSRTLAFAGDYIVISGYFVLLIAAGAWLHRTAPTVSEALFGGPVRAQVAGFFLLTLPVTLYFSLMESSARQASFGKGWTRLRVVRKDGEALRLGQALVRNALKFVPWELTHLCIWQFFFAADPTTPIFMVGFVTVWILVGLNVISLLVDGKRRTLYDRLAGTEVVRSTGPN